MGWIYYCNNKSTSTICPSLPPLCADAPLQSTLLITILLGYVSKCLDYIYMSNIDEDDMLKDAKSTRYQKLTFLSDL